MKKNILLTSVVSLTGLALIACSQPVTPKKVSANKDYKLGAVAGTEYSQKITPQVDILFVIDDSGSMAEEQAKLRKTLPTLIKNLGTHLDWQVAVTRSWDDKKTYGYGAKKIDTKFVPATVEDLGGARPMIKGELLPVIDPGTGEIYTTKIGKRDVAQRFINKRTASAETPNYEKFLEKHFDIGVRGYLNGGPNHEVLMDSAREALTKTTKAGKINDGFLRHGSRLVLVFLTDAPDDSSYDIADYEATFRSIAISNLKSGAQLEEIEAALTVYAIVPFKGGCAAGNLQGDRDPDINGLKLPEELRTYQLVQSLMTSKTSDYTFDICSSDKVYQNKMDLLGASIKKGTKIYVNLTSGRPDDRLQVWYGKGKPGTESFVGKQLVDVGYNDDWYYENKNGKDRIVVNLSAFDKYNLDTVAGEIKLLDYYPDQKAK